MSILTTIASDAQMIAHYAYQIEANVAFISDLPTFRTAAEAELEAAEGKLLSALTIVSKARATMRPAAKMKRVG